MTGPHPAVAAIRLAIRHDLAGIAPGALVLAAVSGGPDSLALAAGLAFVAPRQGLAAGALIVDHQLQPGSSEVAQRAARTCRALGLDPVEVLPVRVAAAGAGPEAAARDARYQALAAAADRLQAVAILLGHTRDDQAETVLLRMARGSGTRSLAAMASRRGRLHRPLLRISRAQTEQATAALGLDPWRDPHNQDPQFTRSRVRQALPVLEQVLGPGLVIGLARTAELAREDADALDCLAEEAMTALRPHELSEGWPVAGLADLLPAIRSRVLLRSIIAAGSPPAAVGFAHVAAVAALVLDWHGQGPVNLPGGVVARRECGRLLLCNPPA